MRLITLAALFLGVLLSTAGAGEKVALVIGNAGYSGAIPIEAAAANAGTVANALRARGFTVTELIDADRNAMLAAMEDIGTRMSNGGVSVGLFYYCGYAGAEFGENFLMPADFNAAASLTGSGDLLFDGVGLGDFLSSLQGATAPTAVILDWRARADLALLTPFAPIPPRDGSVVMSLPGGAAGPLGDRVLADSLARRLADTNSDLAAILEGVREDVTFQLAAAPEIVAPPGGIPPMLLSDIFDIPSGGGGSASPPEAEVGSPDAGGGIGNPDTLTGTPPGSSDCFFLEDCQNPVPLDSPGGGGGGNYDSGDTGTYPEEQDALPGSPLDGGSDGMIASEPPPEPESEPPTLGTDDGSVLPGSPLDPEAIIGTAPEPSILPAPEPESPPLGTDDGNVFTGSPPEIEPGTGVAPEPPAPVVTETPGTIEPLPPPPPTTAPDTSRAATTEVVRYPTLDAPEETIAGEEITVTVALTEEQLTPDVTIKPGPTSTLTDEGALALSLPAETDEWPVDIDLLAAGFDLTDGGKWSRRITLFREGDSDFARFTLKARTIRDPSKPRQLIARLYHQGEFLGSVSRPITVLREPPLQADAPPDGGGAAAASAPVTLAALPSASNALSTAIGVGGEASDVPDLDVTIHYSDPDRLGDGLIIIHSPHIGAPVSAEFTTPEGMNEWLNSEYLRLVDLGLKLRGAVPLSSDAATQDPQAQKRFIARVAEGFGLDLYRNYVPDTFKQVFWSLKGEGRLRSIQVTSNSPVLPWELVLPEAADGTPDGFLGISYRLARWAPRSEAGQVDRPLDRMAYAGIAAVAPSYDGNHALPFQQVEVDALSKLDGFRLVGGDFGSFETMLGEVSAGFIHFSGHGEVNDPGTGSPVFAIRLLDQALDPTTWRALTFAPHDKGNPFFFFNACDTGRARSLGGFVQGWGPAVLASGASGFIGGMWPLSDRTAADFSTDFYGGIAGHLKDGPVYVAEVLQDVRKAFYETGDPTYLAYTFYGNANLQVVRE